MYKPILNQKNSVPQIKDQQIQQLKKDLLVKNREVKRLQELATKDPLTRLYNRQAFLGEVDRFLGAVNFGQTHLEKRKGLLISSASILFFDLDNFKKINDSYGHKVGDQILQYIAELIISKIRSIDIAARWGGEEMLAFLIGAREEEAFRKAEEIRKAITNRVTKIPILRTTKVTVSIGVAEFGPGKTLAETIRQADQAMYQAKRAGKNKVVCWSKSAPG